MSNEPLEMRDQFIKDTKEYNTQEIRRVLQELEKKLVKSVKCSKNAEGEIAVLVEHEEGHGDLPSEFVALLEKAQKEVNEHAALGGEVPSEYLI